MRRFNLDTGTALFAAVMVVCIELAGGQDDPGRQAYTGAGCGGCHGPTARGGVDGPAMVPMEVTESEFAQSFYVAMPGFEATDEELSLIYAYLRDLTEPSGNVEAVRPVKSKESFTPGSAADAKALREGAAQFEVAWNRKDAKAISDLFTMDAERIAINGERVIGRASVEKQFAESFVNRPASDAVTVTPVSIHFLSPDVAVTHGTWRIAGGPDESNNGNYMNLAVKRGDRWLLIRSMAMRPTEP